MGTKKKTTATKAEDRSPELHDDGTVTYWSHYGERLVEGARVVSHRELAKMTAKDRAAVEAHLTAGG